jgi:hypothetical protein
MRTTEFMISLSSPQLLPGGSLGVGWAWLTFLKARGKRFADVS